METNVNRDAVLTFLEYARNNGINLQNAASVGQALSYMDLVRQGNPFGPRTSAGKIYDGGPWTWFSGDIISDVVSGGSPLSRWLPTRAVMHRQETVSHLTWVAPDGWDGQDYASYLDSLVLGECEYGPSPKWEACQYTVRFGKMSGTSQTMHLVPDWAGQREYERSPIFRMRGNNAGLPLQNDAEFAAAAAALQFEQHLNWNLALGAYGSPMQSDGLSEVIALNYVANHIVGDGACDWSDPVVIDGSTLATVADILQMVRGLVRYIKQRAIDRNMTIAPGDMAIVMPLPMWHVIADQIPVGALYPAPSSLTTGGMIPEIAEGYRQRIMAGGIGYGYLPVDGVDIPVIPGNEFGSNVNSNTQMTSDIFVVTRRAGGMVLLEQQYLDWTALPGNVPNRQFSLTQGGIMRYGWLESNQTCYQYFIEAYNRLVSYFQPLQGRITSVTVDALGPHIIESSTYTDAFYANMGTPGSLGAGV